MLHWGHFIHHHTRIARREEVVIVVNKKYLTWGVGIGALGIVATLVLKSGPLAYSRNPLIEALDMVWTFLHAHIYLLVVALSPRYLSSVAAILFIFIQWFLVGYFVTWIFGKIRTDRTK